MSYLKIFGMAAGGLIGVTLLGSVAMQMIGQGALSGLLGFAVVVFVLSIAALNFSKALG